MILPRPCFLRTTSWCLPAAIKVARQRANRPATAAQYVRTVPQSGLRGRLRRSVDRVPFADRHRTRPLNEGKPMTEMAYDAPPSVDDAEISRQRLATRAAKPLQWFLKLLPGIALVLFWQWASGRLIREIYVSKPTAVAHRLFELFASGEIYPHLWTTGQELVLGYVIGVAGGVIGGFAVGRLARVPGIFRPFWMAFYRRHKIALAPALLLSFWLRMW